MIIFGQRISMKSRLSGQLSGPQTLPLSSNGNVGDTIQKLFAANTVEELIVYKASLQSQAAAVDDDVRAAIGQRYRDLLATCAEVVGMGAVCQNIERARQKRHQTSQQMGGSRRFAAAMRAHQATIESPLNPQLSGSMNNLNTTISLIQQGLTSRLGSLQVLLHRCLAPTGVLEYAAKLDSQLVISQTQPRANSAPASATSPVSMASPLPASTLSTLAAMVPPPSLGSNGSSQMLFKRTALEHSQLLSLCNSFVMLLRKCPAATEERENNFAAGTALAIESQLLNVLGARASRPRDASLTRTSHNSSADIRSQMEVLIVRAIGDLYRADAVGHKKFSTGPATTATTLLFYSDIHQALTIEEQLVDTTLGGQSSKEPAALRSLLRLIDLQEMALRKELDSFNNKANEETHKRTTTVLKAADLCVNGVNGLLSYLAALLAALKGNIDVRTSVSGLQQQPNVTNFLLSLTAATKPPLTVTAAASKGSPSSAKDASLSTFTTKSESDALLDSLLVHACGTVDVEGGIDFGSVEGKTDLPSRMEQLATAVFSSRAGGLITVSNEALVFRSVGESAYAILSWDTEAEQFTTQNISSFATPPRSGGAGAWALSPSPMPNSPSTGGGDANPMNWATAVASALMPSGDAHQRIEDVLSARMSVLQKALVGLLFGDEANAGSSFLSFLVAPSRSSHTSASDPIQSAEILQSLESSLLSLGTGHAVIWDTKNWGNTVAQKLSTFVESSVTILVRGMATAAMSIASQIAADFPLIKDTNLLSSSTDTFIPAGVIDIDGALAGSPTSATPPSAGIEEKIITLIASRVLQDQPSPLSGAASIQQPKSSSIFSQHLSAIAATLSRNSSSPHLQSAVKNALLNDLLGVLDKQVGAKNGEANPSISRMAPPVGLLISSVDALSASSGSQEDSSHAAIQLLTSTLRPPLVSLFCRCFECWTPSITKRFKSLLISGWKSQLLANSSVPMRLEMGRLVHLADIAHSLAAKQSSTGKPLPPKAAKLLNIVKHSDQFIHNVRDLKAEATKRFRNSIQPLLWSAEIISVGDEGGGASSTVPYPKRCHPLIAEALWWVQRTINTDLRLLFAGVCTGTQGTAQGNIITAQKLAQLSARILSPSLFLALQQGATEAFNLLYAEGVAAGKRATEAEAALRKIFSETSHLTNISKMEKVSMSDISTAPVKAANEGNGWGNDDEDFELDYGDNEKPSATEEMEKPETSAAVQHEKPAEEEDVEIDEDLVLNEYAQSAEALPYGICEDFYLQLLMDFLVLGKALGGSNSTSWAAHCNTQLAVVQDEVDVVTWNLTLPMIKASAAEYNQQGQLLWSLGLSAASVGQGLSAAHNTTMSALANSSSYASLNATSMGTSVRVPCLLTLPKTEVERFALLPVALPQASHTALPPAPILTPSSTYTTQPHTTSGTKDVGTSRLVQGATASLKSFLGGW